MGTAENELWIYVFKHLFDVMPSNPLDARTCINRYADAADEAVRRLRNATENDMKLAAIGAIHRHSDDLTGLVVGATI